jgi:flagellar biosynthesis/type III secretory pathway protein FliH
LDISRADSIIKESLKKGQDARMRAYLGTLLLANPQVIKEVVRMRNGTLTLEKALEETGLTAKWKTEGKAEGKAEGIAEGEARGKAEGKAEGEAAGREEKALEIARNLIRKGWSAQEIAETINLGLDKIKPLYRAQGQRTPKTR